MSMKKCFPSDDTQYLLVNGRGRRSVLHFQELCRRIYVVQLSHAAAAVRRFVVVAVSALRVASEAVNAVRCGDDLADDVAAEHDDRQRYHDRSHRLHVRATHMEK